MPLDKLEKQILDDARRRAAEIEAEAKKQAENIVRQARASAKGIEEETNREVAREIARAEEEQRENAELQKRSMLLGAREHAVEGLVPRLKSMTVKKLKSSGYEKLIRLAVKEAGNIAPDEEMVLTINKKDARLLKSFSGKVRYGNVGNGIEIATKDGKIKILATLDSLFEANLPEIKTILIREAFSQVKQSTSRRKKTEKKNVKKKRR